MFRNTLFNSFSRHANRTALITNQKYTYQELLARALAVSSYLELRKTTCEWVAIRTEHNLETYVGILGILFSGKGYLPIPTEVPLARAEWMMKASGCQVELNSELIRSLGESTDTLEPKSPESAWAYLLFTSGSTGTPKGVPVSRDNLLCYLNNISRLIPIHHDSRCTQWFELNFDLSVHDLFFTWLHGAALIPISGADRFAPLKTIQRHSITHWFSVPSVAATLSRLRLLTPNALPSLQVSLFCGEPLPVSLCVDWFSSAPTTRIWNLYGPTEATIAISSIEVPRSIDDSWKENAWLPIGDIFSSQNYRVIDKKGDIVQKGTPGELALSGSQITAGYLEMAASEQKKHGKLPDSHALWYRTGDLVKEGTHGLDFIGRIDFQVKVRGFRVELEEIESALTKLCLSESTVVMGWPRKNGVIEGLVAFIIHAKNTDTNQILGQLRACVLSPIIPNRLIFIDGAPLTPNGKLDRKALASMLEENA